MVTDNELFKQVLSDTLVGKLKWHGYSGDDSKSAAHVKTLYRVDFEPGFLLYSPCLTVKVPEYRTRHIFLNRSQAKALVEAMVYRQSLKEYSGKSIIEAMRGDYLPG